MHNQISQREFTRSDIMGMEQLLLSHPDVYLGDSELCPLTHSFADNIYVREMKIPAGTAIVGSIHKHSHPNFILSGTIRVVTEFGYKEISGPTYMISEPGTKRACVAVTDTVWVTVHHNPTDTRDVEFIKNNIIADDYEDYERFKSTKANPVISFFKKLIKKIS